MAFPRIASTLTPVCSSTSYSSESMDMATSKKVYSYLAGEWSINNSYSDKGEYSVFNSSVKSHYSAICTDSLS